MRMEATSAILPAPAPMYNAATPAGPVHVLANGDIVDCGRLPTTARNSLYKTELCKHFMDSGACRYGSKCQFAHGEEELRGVLRHPKYKTTRCKAFVTTGRCMYGSRCRFIHVIGPDDETTSMTSDMSDDTEADLLVNPYANGTKPIDLSLPFGGLKQVTLTPLTSMGSSLASPPEMDFLLFRDPFSDLKLGGDSETASTSSLLDSLELSASSSSSPSSSSSSSSDGSASVTKLSRLSVFQRICREGDATASDA